MARQDEVPGRALHRGQACSGGCGEKCDLSMETLVWTRGRALPRVRLPERLKCPRRVGRKIRLLYDIPSEPGSGAERVQVWNTKDVV
jgi:hypothetical protein